MISIVELLNKIKWDKNLNPEEYSVFYLDRITKGLIEIKYLDIKKIEKSFIVIEKNNEEVNIPLHRIRRVERNKRLIWER
jgi:uncharacterized protein (UPF0248 family)